MADCDIVIVGSGINSLVAGALLSRKGYRVRVLERNAWLGGCIKTDEVTVPGFHHDVFSSWHPLFVASPAYAELHADLAAQGLEYVNTPKPTAAVLPDGRQFILRATRAENVTALAKHAASQGLAYERAMADIEHNAPLIFGLLSQDVRKFATAWLLARATWKSGFAQMWDFGRIAMESCRKWLEDSFPSEEVRACFAPWVLHAGLGPDDAFSGLMGKLVAFTLEHVGMPVVKGGSANLVQAFSRLIESNGGTLHTGRPVKKILVRDGRACGVAVEGGEVVTASRAVLCNVTPTQLYGTLLGHKEVLPTVREQSLRYRYGSGCMQIHLALSTAPRWRNPELDDVAIVHLTEGLDGVSKAVGEARRGLLPATATVVVGQPTALDPSRAPVGKAILWLQLQELPWHVKGDAAGEIPVPQDGLWTDALKNAYADRIVARLAGHVPGLQGLILKRTVLSPRDLQAHNINLVNGDPYSGACTVDQFMAWRPSSAVRGHRTPVKNLYHIGASTHPGPGLGGTSGYIVSRYFR